MAEALRVGLPRLGTVEAPGQAVAGGACVAAGALGAVVGGGVAGVAAFATAGSSDGAVAALGRVRESEAPRALFKGVRWEGPLYRDPFPVHPDTCSRVGTGAGYSLSPSVVSINKNKGENADFSGRVKGGSPRPGWPIDNSGSLEGDVSPKLVEEVGLGGEAAIGLVDNWGPKDNHLGEPFAGNEIEGVVEGLEDDLAVFPDQVHRGFP